MQCASCTQNVGIPFFSPQERGDRWTGATDEMTQQIKSPNRWAEGYKLDEGKAD